MVVRFGRAVRQRRPLRAEKRVGEDRGQPRRRRPAAQLAALGEQGLERGQVAQLVAGQETRRGRALAAGRQVRQSRPGKGRQHAVGHHHQPRPERPGGRQQDLRQPAQRWRRARPFEAAQVSERLPHQRLDLPARRQGVERQRAGADHPQGAAFFAQVVLEHGDGRARAIRAAPRRAPAPPRRPAARSADRSAGVRPAGFRAARRPAAFCSRSSRKSAGLPSLACIAAATRAG